MADDIILPFLFECPRIAMRLTARGCGKLWESANATPIQHRCGSGFVAAQDTGRPAPWESRSACIGCPTGCRNAGHEPPPERPLADLMRVRCEICGAVSDRLVNKKQCVSHFNRRREALRERNARGSRPNICDELHAERWAVIDNTAVSVKTFGPIVSPFEALLQAARTATGGTVAIGRPGVTLVPDQTAEAEEKIAT